MLTPYVLLVAASLAHPAAAPRLHVETSCRAVSSLALAGGQSFDECMRDETDAQKELGGKWNGYPAAARSRCSAEVMIGGDPSYVELLECLEMDRSVRQGGGAVQDEAGGQPVPAKASRTGHAQP